MYRRRTCKRTMQPCLQGAILVVDVFAAAHASIRRADEEICVNIFFPSTDKHVLTWTVCL